MNNEAIVSFKNVCMYFGGVKAIDDISFDVDEGQVFGIIGPNGAGKTTIFNVLSGIYKPTSGDIYFHNRRINNLPPNYITGNGITRTFQNIRLFENQTVLDNLKIAHYSHIRYGIIDVIFTSNRFKKEEERIEEESLAILDFMNLTAYAEQKAGALPYGAQRRIEIARALSCKPEVLLLDEPAAGMNPVEIDELNQLILKIRNQFNLTVLVVEHQMRLVMEICNEILVTNFGRKLAIGKPNDIKNNPEVLEAYLGKVKSNE